MQIQCFKSRKRDRLFTFIYTNLFRLLFYAMISLLNFRNLVNFTHQRKPIRELPVLNSSKVDQFFSTKYIDTFSVFFICKKKIVLCKKICVLPLLNQLKK